MQWGDTTWPKLGDEKKKSQKVMKKRYNYKNYCELSKKALEGHIIGQ